MNLIKAHKLEIAFAIYWLANVGNTVYVSRNPGHYPKQLTEQARLIAKMRPYPWPDIIVASIVIGVATAIMYLVIKKTNNSPLTPIVYCLGLLMLFSVATPTDVGGVNYAFADFIVFSFIGAGIYAITEPILKRF